MSSVVISGDTSGAITLAAPAIAGTNTLSLPAQTATIATLTTPSFATTIGVGGATAAASGAGITFPASQSTSSDANTLDDYEEGTWSPSVGGNATYTSQVGRYTKIGNIVSVYFDITINILGTGSTANITNLPFTTISEMSASGCVSYYTGLTTSFTWIGCYAAGGTTNVAFVGNAASATTTANFNGVALFGNGSRVLVSLVYRVA
jgi:hypothetical protein